MPIKFDAEDKLLKDILTGLDRYQIPPYQRPYSWTEDEVADLWNDIKEDGSSFLGSFVFNYENYDKDKVIEVIDGQQRLITLTLLMSTLRDVYRELGDTDKADLIQTTTIERRDIISGKAIYRLICGDSLNSFFSENIQRKDSKILAIKPPRRREEKLIRENYEFLRNKILGEIEQKRDKSKQLEFLDDLREKIFDLKIIWIRIDSDDDAYSIFETVNARGADLTAADLLKNYLFQNISKKKGDIDDAKEKWLEMANNIESAKGPLNLSKFIRYYWLSRYGFVPEKKLYREVKRTIEDQDSFLSDLLVASEYYYKIASESVHEDIWIEEFENRKIGQKIYETLSGLRMMGITQCYSLLLCLLMNKDRIGYDFSDTFKLIEQYHFVYSSVCKLSGNVVEKLYIKTARDIQEALKIPTPSKRRGSIERILANFRKDLDHPTEDFFVERFMDISYKDYDLVVYILSNIEKSLSKTKETDINFSKVNIEHILPQDPNAWDLSKKDVKEYVNKLGNLTLISKKINGSIGNKPLKIKAELFKESELKLNQELMEKFESTGYKWTDKEILNRQKELAIFAYNKVWKFK